MLVSLATGTSVFFGSGAPAWANCNGRFHNYFGQVSTPAGFGGIEGFINLANSRLASPGTEFIALWSGVDDNGTSHGCLIDGFYLCWAQAGMWRGLHNDVNRTVANIYQAYFGRTTPDGYFVNYWASSQIGLPPNPFLNVFTSNISRASGDVKYVSCVNNGGGPIKLGESWMDHAGDRLQSQAEMFSSGAQEGLCPTIETQGINGYQFFGTRGPGTVSPDYALKNLPATGGSNWTTWTSPVTTSRDYEFDRLTVNGSFKTKGGRD